MDAHKKAASIRGRGGSPEDHSADRHDTRPRPARRRVESAETQCMRLLAYLNKAGSVSTREARSSPLRIMHPAGRIYDLRKAGVEIITVKDGRQGCGRYRLLGGGTDG